MRACFRNNQALEEERTQMLFPGWDIRKNPMVARGDGPIMLTNQGSEMFITSIAQDSYTCLLIDEWGDMKSACADILKDNSIKLRSAPKII